MEQTPRLLAGRYEVGELIGRGGMAEVHVGRDVRLGRTVAIKILREELARDPSFQARFRREAQSSAALNHPSIVAVYDTGEEVLTSAAGSSVNVPFIVMEYVEGHTVRDILREGNPVPINEAIEITIGVLTALEYSHQAGIVHRDIKPGNIMITPQGAVKVMDFGIARAMADSAATMTQTQAVIGTAQYLSPEQARGEQVDTRSDLYSTGCLLFELLTGRPPFQGDSPVAVAYQHVREEPPLPSSIASDIPETLDRITLMSLTKERDQRYHTADEFRSDLEAVLHGGNIMAPGIGAAMAAGEPATEVLGQAQDPATQAFGAAGGYPNGQWDPTAAGDPEEEEEPKKKRGLMWTLIGVGIAAIIAIILLLVFGGGDEKEEPEPTPTMVSVPSLVDMDPNGARMALEEVNLQFRQGDDEPSDEVEEGRAVSSDPEEGEEVEEGTVVTVRFSSGPDSVEVPDVTGLSQEDARKQLEDADLSVGNVSSTESGSVQKDHVISTDPGGGEVVEPGSAVSLSVSNGMVDVPDLVGEKIEDAEETLSTLGLTSRAESVETDEQDPDHVVEQSASGLVEQGSSITLTYAVEPPDDPDDEDGEDDEGDDNNGNNGNNGNNDENGNNDDSDNAHGDEDWPWGRDDD